MDAILDVNCLTQGTKRCIKIDKEKASYSKIIVWLVVSILLHYAQKVDLEGAAGRGGRGMMIGRQQLEYMGMMIGRQQLGYVGELKLFKADLRRRLWILGPPTATAAAQTCKRWLLRNEALDDPNQFGSSGWSESGRCGREMIADVFLDCSTYAEPPSRFEVGTPAIGAFQV